MTNAELTALVEAIEHTKHISPNGTSWECTFEYPGYFAWTAKTPTGWRQINASPDWTNVGEIDIARENSEGASEGLDVIAYTEPLTREAYVALIVPILDRESEVSL